MKIYHHRGLLQVGLRLRAEGRIYQVLEMITAKPSRGLSLRLIILSESAESLRGLHPAVGGGERAARERDSQHHRSPKSPPHQGLLIR